MLERAKKLLQPSARSAVPPFMVMDVVAAAARLEAQGRRIIHMEVGQPAAGAPATAIAAARAALSSPLRYTETLGVASLRQRIARAYAEWHGLDIDPARIVVTTGSSAGFILAFLAAFDAGDRVAVPLPGYPPYRHILTALGCQPVGIETDAATRWSITGEALLAHHRVKPLKGVIVASPANPSGTMMTATGACRRCALRRGRRHRCHLRRDLSRAGLRVCCGNSCAHFRRRADRQFLFQIFLHDRMAHRLDGGAAAIGAGDRAAAAKSGDLGADIVANCRRGGFRGASRTGKRAARLRGKPADLAGRIAARRIGFVFAGRRRVLLVCRRVAIFRTTALHSRNACWTKRAWRLRRASTSIPHGARISCGCVMPAHAKICAKRSSGSGIG